MSYVGNLSIQCHSLELENFFGRKAILRMLMNKMQLNLLWIYWIIMLVAMNNYSQYHVYEEENQKMKNLLELISQLPLRFMFQFLEEVFRELLLINLEWILQRCSTFNLRIKKGKKNMLGKLHGVYQLVVLELWLWFIQTISVSFYLLELLKFKQSSFQSLKKVMTLKK